MTRIAFSLVVCLILASEAQAVRLMDGEAVGQLFGYVAACAKNVGMNPPATQEAQQVGERYAMWLQNNGANVGRVINDLQTNIGIGMSAAVRSNYSNCEDALREMIGFYEYFNAKGTGLYSILEEYEHASTSTDDFLAFVREQQKKEQQQKTIQIPLKDIIGEYSTPKGSTGDMEFSSLDANGTFGLDLNVSSKADGSNCLFSGRCVVKGNKVTCDNQETDQDSHATLEGIVSKGQVEFTSGLTQAVCDPRGSMFGVYKRK